MEESSESSEDEDRQHPPKEERQKNGRADVDVKGTKRKKNPPARDALKRNEKEPERRSKDKKTQIQKVEDSVRFFHQVMYGGITEPEKKKRKRKKKKPSLVDAMCGRRDGLGKLLDVFTCFQFDDGEANPIPPAQLLMQGMDLLEEWQLKLAPYFAFKDFLREVEKLGDNKKIRATIAELGENKKDRQVVGQEEEHDAPSQNDNLS